MKCILKVALLIILFNIQTTYSQSKNHDIVIGKNHTINSSILKGERGFQVYLPKNYHDSEKKYPVLYILDGQLHFKNGVAIQESLQVPGAIPEMIIVGLQNNYPRRTDIKWSKKETYYSFLADELIPYIDKTYKTSKTRVLFGWEMSAFISSYMLLNEEPLFDGVILSNGGSPTVEMVEAFKKGSNLSNYYLYMTNSKKDIYTIEYTNDLAKLLENEAPKNLKWIYKKFDNETHETLPYLTMYYGLRYFYYNFESVNFSSFEDYEQFGGIPSLKTYFKERGERFSFPKSIDDSTKNGLIWLAWNKDNFDYFKLFMNEFKDVLSTKRYQSGYWQNRLGQMYLKHGDITSALTFFNNGINNFSDSKELAEMHFGIAQANFTLKKKKEAKKHIKTAIKIAEEKSDSNLEKYQEYLSKIN